MMAASLSSSSLTLRAENIIQDLFLDACKSNDLEKVRSCVVLGVDVNCKDENGFSGLYYAARENCLVVLEYLLNRDGINVNCKTKNHLTPLMIACVCGNSEVVQRLCQVPDIDLNSKDIFGDTALRAAVYYNNLECVKVFRNLEGVHWNETHWDTVGRRYREPALIVAVERRYVDILEILLSVPSLDLKVKNLEGQSLPQIIHEWNCLDKARLKISELLTKDPRIDNNAVNKGAVSNRISGKSNEKKLGNMQAELKNTFMLEKKKKELKKHQRKMRNNNKKHTNTDHEQHSQPHHQDNPSEQVISNVRDIGTETEPSTLGDCPVSI